jgi:Domain of unknown function (DUF4232)
MRISLIGLAMAAALALGGCGGSSASSTSQPAAATSQTTSSSTSSASPAASSSSSTASSTAAPSSSTTSATSTASAGGGASVGGPAPCRAAGLALTYLGGQGATGHGELGFALRNTGQASCSTGGYPGIQFLDNAGGALPTTPTHTTSDFFGNLPLSAVTVSPGNSFSFRLGVSHGGGSGAGCTTAYGLQVIPPNDTATLHVQIPGGASECGATTVSPVQPGTSAFR